MFGSYLPDDVTVLLKDITGLVEPLGTKEREARIQSGVHYCEMLPVEYEPTEKYMEIYERALCLYSKITADAAADCAMRIFEDKGKNAVLVSLARAGTSAGVLLKRYIKGRFGADVPHYTISIIRGRGIDKNAIDYILKRHSPKQIQFVDGWTGKGAIQRELKKAMLCFPEISTGLAVFSDPAFAAEKCGTHEDILIASSLLNSTVSGLLSRTFLRSDIISENDFHGAAFYKELAAKDRTYEFINAIERHFDFSRKMPSLSGEENPRRGLDEVNEIAEKFGIDDINLIKPGIGEATRVLLRRVPWKLLVHSLSDNEHLSHLYRLAEEKGVEVEEYPLKNYKACGIIRNLADS
ncbi:MAG: cysteine protease StiP family protein [Oscillospiraceae bacterium]|nr:cysteine protease StiP family protein [Oscillospiraceae bacterium]